VRDVISNSIPLYYLVIIFSKTERIKEAKKLAEEIICKPIKVKKEDSFKVVIFAKKFLETNCHSFSY